MKTLLKLLTLVTLTAVISSTITYLVVSKIDSTRRAREQTAYETELSKLEAALEAQKRTTITPAVATTSGAVVTAVAKEVSSPQAPPAVPGTTPNAARTRYSASTAGSKCRIDGTSTIHPWKMETPIIGGTFELDSKINIDSTQSTLAGVGEDGRVSAAAEITIPVRALKSYSTRMDEVYQDHMEAIAYRKIEYRLKELSLKKATHLPNTPFEFESKGDLIVHGVTNVLAMPVKIDRFDANKLKISGSTPLKMSDFKVQPPCPKIPGMGEIKTGDDITVSFEWVVENANAPVAMK